MATQVQPLLIEQEHITTFIIKLKGAYFEKLVRYVQSNFSYLIIMRGQVKDSIQHRKFSDNSAKFAKPNTKKQTFLKKKESGSLVAGQIIASPYKPY